MINWFNAQAHCYTHTLIALLREVHVLKLLFDFISVHHIYKARNKVADKLSKEASELIWGTWHITEFNGSQIFRFFHRPFIEDP